jgi:deoxyribodipyrimidine photolyase
VLRSATFLLECVADLRARLRERGSDLLVRVGRPEAVLPQLARATGAAAVYAHAEVTAEELALERRVGAALESAGAPLRPLWGSTLHHVDDLPFAVADMPANYGAFRGAVAGTRVRAALPTPAALRRLPVACPEAGDMPTLAQLGVPPLATQPVSAEEGQQQPAAAAPGLADMRGGETEALRRLKAFASRGAAQPAAASAARASAATTGAAGGGMYGANFSCNISPWLAVGCISPRRMYEELRAAHGISGAPGAPGATTAAQAAAPAASASAPGNANNLNWLVFEARCACRLHVLCRALCKRLTSTLARGCFRLSAQLVWRDFFRFITLKHCQSAGGKAAAPATAAKLGGAPA